MALGEALGLRGGRLRELARAGILHDVGKLSVPHAILAKPGRLTDAEMDVIRRHPGWGEELLAELGYPERIRRWVRGHHERLDGSGYPDALGGPRLDLETRILAVADVYDALVSRACTAEHGRARTRWRCCARARERCTTSAASPSSRR